MENGSDFPIQIKATRDGFILVPEAGVSFEVIRDYLKQRLDESQDFFRNSEMTLDVRKRSMETSEIASIHKLLVQQAMVKVVEVKLTDDLSFMLEHTPGPRIETARATPEEVCPDGPMIVKSTCRSGVRIESPGDCIVLGDVNPGAEVVAVGDVIVFGSLRGIAHAGALGDRSARIWAISIEPSQIRIADLVALPPRGGRPLIKKFEVAEVEDNLIEVISK